MLPDNCCPFCGRPRQADKRFPGVMFCKTRNCLEYAKYERQCLQANVPVNPRDTGLRASGGSR